mgnify:CR=1 FL=1|jgi:hypothetical protein|tara:strand:+ start:942 stop:1370 length:429 start_codon:yes stop_codon:yes gene_type:complete
MKTLLRIPLAILPLVVVALIFPAHEVEAACGDGFDKAPAYQHDGWKVFAGLLYQKNEMTGRNLPAHKGFFTKNLGTCIQQCIGTYCMAITYRPKAKNGNTCLLYAGYDFQTKSPMVMWINPNFRTHHSVIIRANNGKGRLCR